MKGVDRTGPRHRISFFTLHPSSALRRMARNFRMKRRLQRPPSCPGTPSDQGQVL